MSTRELSLLQITRKFPDSESAEQSFIKRLWKNGVGSFRALLGRSYHGTHHWMSAKHLAPYVNEFATRSILRGDNTINFMEHIAREMSGKSVTYKELIHEYVTVCGKKIAGIDDTLENVA